MIVTHNSQFAYQHNTYHFTFNHQLSFDSHYPSFDTLLILRSNNYHNYHNYVSTRLSIHSYHLTIHGYLSTHQLCFDIVILRHTDYVSVNTLSFGQSYPSVNTTMVRSMLSFGQHLCFEGQVSFGHSYVSITNIFRWTSVTECQLRFSQSFQVFPNWLSINTNFTNQLASTRSNKHDSHVYQEP